MRNNFISFTICILSILIIIIFGCVETDDNGDGSNTPKPTVTPTPTPTAFAIHTPVCGNLVKNGDLSNDFEQYWIYYAIHDTSVDVTVDTSSDGGINPMLKVTVIDAGTIDWGIAVYQDYEAENKIVIQYSHDYSISFKAKLSDASISETKIVEAGVGMSSSPYDHYGKQTFTIAKGALQDYSFSFTMQNDNDYNAQFFINFGNFTDATDDEQAIVYIDDIELLNLSCL